LNVIEPASFAASSLSRSHDPALIKVSAFQLFSFSVFWLRQPEIRGPAFARLRRGRRRREVRCRSLADRELCDFVFVEIS
jgi:hypothetical protein